MAPSTGEGGLRLVPTNKGDSYVRHCTLLHYSDPWGFVGRQLLYRIEYNGQRYGVIGGGSATKHLPGRSDFFGTFHLNSIVNNTFFHLQRLDGRYPCHNFAPLVVEAWRYAISIDWSNRYGDTVLGFETLVELPRTGELYRRDGWTEVGETRGETCKRFGGVSTDSWSGRRVWNRIDLRPKRVFVRVAQ